MKREDLKALNLEDATIDAIMALHGKGIETLKSNLTTAQGEVENLKGQLGEANKQIEGFKGMDVESIQKAADDWKAKFEQAEKDYQGKLATMQFDTELDTALAGAKVKNLKAVKALLSTDNLRDANGKFIPERLTEQVEKIKSEADYLFESDTPAPKIVQSTNNQNVVTDKFEAAMRQGANLK